jgi:agmatinase
VSDPVGPPDASVVPRFAGPETFARLPRLSEVRCAEVAILGAPFDAGVSYRPGARFGPGAVRAASRLLRPYHPELQARPWETQQVADGGDAAINPFSIEQAMADIETAALRALDRARRVVTIGGDHTIALPLLRAVGARHRECALIHFDAHLDTWDSYFGAGYTHGTSFRRAAEEDLLDTSRSLHVGIRGPLYSGEDLAQDAALGYGVISTAQIARSGVAAAIERIRTRVGNGPVYVSVDVDVLDPAHAPGTGTPEPGGLTTRELQELLRGLDGLEIAGADVVEVSPPYDHAELTALAAAQVVYELLALLARA